MTAGARILDGMRSTPPRIRVVVAARSASSRAYRDALTAAGIQIVADCGHAADLLAAVSREHPDVCLVDRDLRGGALAVAAAISAPTKSPKVLVVGGRGTAAERRAARLAGAADSVPADIAAADLAAAVSALVQKEQP